MILLRRFLVLIGLFFWQGGFTFYASVVVPIGQQQFGHLRQGFVTRQVTIYLNLAGAAALVLLLWELLASADRAAWRRRSRWLLWAGMLLTLIHLHWLHGQLDELLAARGFLVRDDEAFRPQHRLYLWISTVQWACGLLFLFLTLGTWRAHEGLTASSKTPSPSESSVQSQDNRAAVG